MNEILSLFQTSWFRGYIIAPLAIVGFYQIFRGIAMIVEKDISEKEWLRGWVVVAYLLVTVLGCLCLVIAL